MSNRNFRQMLEKKWGEGKFVCVGLDSDYDKIPESAHKKYLWETILEFNLKIVDTTSDLVQSYKLNPADYAPYGAEGLNAIWQTIANINRRAPDIPVILDGKYGGGIQKENLGYARYAFDFLKADAVTVNPYPGHKALQPFLDCRDKGIFVLCRTSDSGAGEFQDFRISTGPILIDNDPMSRPLYQIVAQNVAADWNKNGNCGLVVGATYPEELWEVRKVVGDMPILSPAVGEQGGDLKKAVKAGRDIHDKGMIFSASRSIIFASSGPDFADAARRETLKIHNLINQYREKEAVCCRE